jgi:hypothetical protein
MLALYGWATLFLINFSWNIFLIFYYPSQIPFTRMADKASKYQNRYAILSKSHFPSHIA